MRIKYYADSPTRRTQQVVVDVVALTWLLVAVWAGLKVDDGLDAVAEQVRRIDTAGSSLAGGLGDAGSVLDGTPLVGDEIAAPFERAAGSSGAIAEAGRDTADGIDTLGGWLGFGTALALLAVLGSWYLPGRIRFVVTATLLERFLREGGDPDLLALRALTRQPVGVLVRRHPDAAAAWRAGDRAVIDALAGLELQDAGLRAPDRPAAPPHA